MKNNLFTMIKYFKEIQEIINRCNIKLDNDINFWKIYRSDYTPIEINLLETNNDKAGRLFIEFSIKNILDVTLIYVFRNDEILYINNNGENITEKEFNDQFDLFKKISELSYRTINNYKLFH